MATKKPSSEFVQNAYEIVVDYSGYSTLAGLIYVFMPNQPFFGKVRLFFASTIEGST
jgi:hypothetical protein